MSFPVSPVSTIAAQPAFGTQKSNAAKRVSFGSLTDSVRFGGTPSTRPDNKRGFFGTIWHGVKSTFRWIGRIFSDEKAKGEAGEYAKYKDQFHYRSDIQDALAEHNQSLKTSAKSDAELETMATKIVKGLYESKDNLALFKSKTGLSEEQFKHLFLEDGEPKKAGDLEPIFASLLGKTAQEEAPKAAEGQDPPEKDPVNTDGQDPAKPSGAENTNNDTKTPETATDEEKKQLQILRNKSVLSGNKKIATTKTLLVTENRSKKERETLKEILPFYSSLTPKEKQSLKSLASEETLDGEKLAAWKQLIQKSRLSTDELKQLSELKKKVTKIRTKPVTQVPEQTVFIVNGTPIEIKRKKAAPEAEATTDKTPASQPFKGYQFNSSFALPENGQLDNSKIQYSLVPPQPETIAPTPEALKALTDITNQINAQSLAKVIKKYFGNESPTAQQQRMVDLSQVAYVARQGANSDSAEEIEGTTVIGKILANKKLTKKEIQSITKTDEDKTKTPAVLIRSGLEEIINVLKGEE